MTLGWNPIYRKVMCAMADELFEAENVILVTFGEGGGAYQAMTALGELDSQKQVEVVAAAVVTRGDDGQIQVKDETADYDLPGTAAGGIIGLLIGILGGPLGVLIGGSYGVLVGSLFDVADADDTHSVLAEMSKKIEPGSTAVLAQVIEPSYEVIDSAMARVSGTVVRQSVYAIESEIAAAEEAQRQAEKEARKKLREARHEKTRDEVHGKVEELKAKLPGHKQAAHTSA
jgi:uncharacterized membrane protein